MTDHPLRGRFNAWLLDVADDYSDRMYGAIKRRLFANLPATIVELGAGSGANFRYYPRGSRVIVIEPNVRMHPRLRRRASRAGLTLDLRTAPGEDLPFADASVEFVCASLVLCSVTDPARVVSEIRRVLVPGGRFVCVEHVGAPVRSRAAALQRALRRPWRWLFEGCDLCNHTPAVLEAAGFRSVEITPLDMRMAFPPLRHQIAATCTA
jgi:SAM-dependent methyltransferase